MKTIYFTVKDNPAIVSQFVGAILSLLVAFGLLNFGPEQLAEVQAQVVAGIFAIGQIVAAIASQHYTVPAYRVRPLPKDLSR